MIIEKYTLMAEDEVDYHRKLFKQRAAAVTMKRVFSSSSALS